MYASTRTHAHTYTQKNTQMNPTQTPVFLPNSKAQPSYLTYDSYTGGQFKVNV